MSKRVTFWLGARDGIVSHFLSGPLERFATWLEGWDTPDSVRLVGLASDARMRGAEALRANDSTQALIVDRMLDVYYGSFCDLVEPATLVAAAPSDCSERCYWTAAEGFARHPGGSAGEALWRCLLEGRPVLRDARRLPYVSSDGVFRLGYWSADECDVLADELQTVGATATEAEARRAVAAALEAISRARGSRTGLITVVA